MKTRNTLVLFLTLLSLASCGEDYSGGDRDEAPTQQEETFGIRPQSFSTRLSPTLLIAGVKCRGDETTEPNGNGVICQAEQYLISVDNVNICTNGICTNNVVTPIVGELIDTNARTPGFTVYEIDAKSPVTTIQENILKTVIVTSDFLGNSVVSLTRPLN